MAEQVARYSVKRTMPRIMWPILALGLLFLFNAFFTHNFFQTKISINDLKQPWLYGNLIDILRDDTPQMLLSLGMTLVIATYGVDLSVGSLVAMGATLAAVMCVRVHTSFAVAVAAALAATAFAGLWNGWLVAYLGIQPIVATLILMVAGRGIAKSFSNGEVIFFPAVRSYSYLDHGAFLYLPVCLWIVAGVFLLTWLVTRRTAFGLFVESVGNNQTASRFCGINARMVTMMTYAFSGLCAGIAGLTAASYTSSADPGQLGQWMELDAIFAVVVGGTPLSGGRFSLAGSIVGVILLSTLTKTMIYVGVPPAVAPVPKAIVIVGVCMLQSAKFRLWVGSVFRRSAA